MCWFEQELPNFIKGCLKMLFCISIFGGVQTHNWKDAVFLLWIIDEEFVGSEVSVRW